MPFSQPDIDFRFYDEAKVAESDFHNACIKQFGSANASTFRYISAKFNEETKKAYERKLAADALWRKELQNSNSKSQSYEYSYYDR